MISVLAPARPRHSGPMTPPRRISKYRDSKCATKNAGPDSEPYVFIRSLFMRTQNSVRNQLNAASSRGHGQ